MPYDSQITRADAAALIPQEAEQEIFQAMPQSSVIMGLGRRLRDMSRHEKELRVLDGLATAYFAGATTAASGDTGRLQTSELDWVNKTIKAAKLGCIVPIPRDVIMDQDYDLWGECKGQIAEAMGKAFDAAVIHATGAPSDWPTSLVAGATAASQTIDLSAALGASVPKDLYDLTLGVNGLIAMVEEAGYFVNGHVASISMRAKLRALRESSTGRGLFNSDMQGSTQYSLDGEQVVFPRNGALNPAAALMITGDWSQLVYSLRKDIEYQVLDQATIYDADGEVVYALAQDDMVALKATMRLGWQLPTPPNRIDATPYPFAVLVP